MRLSRLSEGSEVYWVITDVRQTDTKSWSLVTDWDRILYFRLLSIGGPPQWRGFLCWMRCWHGPCRLSGIVHPHWLGNNLGLSVSPDNTKARRQEEGEDWTSPSVRGWLAFAPEPQFEKRRSKQTSSWDIISFNPDAGTKYGILHFPQCKL